MKNLIPFGETFEDYCIKTREALKIGDARWPLVVVKTSVMQQYDRAKKEWLDFDLN
jgi:hypothetical protein